MSTRLLEIKKRQAEITSKVDELKGEELENALKEMRSLDEEKQEIEKRSEITSMLATNPSRTSAVEVRKSDVKEETSSAEIQSTPEYRSAYLKTLQHKELNVIEQRALTTATSSVGYAVPTQTLNKIVEKLRDAGVVLPLVTQFSINGNVEIPVEDTTADLSWKAEGSASTDSADKLGHVALKAYKLIKTISITAEVESMTIDAFEDFLTGMLSKKVKVALDNAIINGTGSGQATGIVTAVTAINAKTAGTLTYDDLIDLKKAVKSGYRQNAVFMLSTDTLAEVEKIKDDQKRPIFKMETDGRFEGKLLGYPVVLCDYVPEGNIIFGDFSYYYLNFARPFEIAESRETGFRSGDVVYRAMGLVDGNVALDEAFGVLEIGTASGT